MESRELKRIFASSVASILAVLSVVVFTVWGDLSPGFKDWLKSFTGHHWVTKGVVMAMVYVVVFGLFQFVAKNVGPDKAKRSVKWLLAVSIAGTLVLFLFFTFHFFGFY